MARESAGWFDYYEEMVPGPLTHANDDFVESLKEDNEEKFIQKNFNGDWMDYEVLFL